MRQRTACWPKPAKAATGCAGGKGCSLHCLACRRGCCWTNLVCCTTARCAEVRAQTLGPLLPPSLEKYAIVGSLRPFSTLLLPRPSLSVRLFLPHRQTLFLSLFCSVLYPSKKVCLQTFAAVALCNHKSSMVRSCALLPATSRASTQIRQSQACCSARSRRPPTRAQWRLWSGWRGRAWRCSSSPTAAGVS